jgi:sugar phosphate isomerase/epimerase
MPPVGNQWVLTLEICDALGVGNVSIAVDVYHVWWDWTLGKTMQAATGRVFGYHLCDWLRDTSDVSLDCGMVGDGVADLTAIRELVGGSGYKGPCEVEYFRARLVAPAAGRGARHDR